MRGGEREGAGRPPGSPNKSVKGWLNLGTTVSPESKNWLNRKKAEGHNINLLVDRALKLLMAKEQRDEPKV